MKDRPKRRLVRVLPAGQGRRWRTVDEQGRTIADGYKSRAQAEHHARALMGEKR